MVDIILRSSFVKKLCNKSYNNTYFGDFDTLNRERYIVKDKS